MRLYCLSDLHLHDTRERFLFTRSKENAFVKMANEARDAGASVLFAGDVFDLTGMQPPEKGLDEFFAGVVPGKTIEVPARRSLGARIRGVIDRYPRFFAALAPLAEQGRVIILPGNHDHGIDSDEGKDALSSGLKVSVDRLRFAETLRAGAFFFGAHGHEFDPSNETIDGGDNPGAVITSTLYHAIVPALEALGLPEDVAGAIPCVRPEENIVPGLQGRLDPDTIHKLLLGFVKLLLENGYFVGHLEQLKIRIATELLTSFLTPEKVRAALADDTDVKDQARQAATDILKGSATAIDVGDGGSPPEAVVLGHTHELDTTESYVNLGTWIDHVRGLGDDDLKHADRRLPLLVLDDEQKWARLHDVAGVVAAGNVKACPLLWRFGVEL
jgi:UDP-2,3-diacylglucosamine pyrophosphatase LpxH